MLALLKSKLIRGGTITILFKLGSILSNYLFFYLIAKSQGSSKVGKFSLLITSLNLLMIFSKAGQDIFMVKTVAGKFHSSKDFIGKTLASTLFNSILLALLILLFKPVLNTSFADLSGEYVLYLIILLPFTTILTTISEYYRGSGDFVKYNLFKDFLRFSIGLVFYAAGLLLAGGSPELFLLVGTSIALLISIAPIKHLFNTKIFKGFWTFYKQNLGNSYYFFLSNASFFLTSWTSILVLGYFCESSEVGIYTMAFKVSNLLLIALMSVNVVATPDFAKYNLVDQQEKIQELAISTSKSMFLMAVPIFLILLLFPGNILQLFGAEFAVGKEALMMLVLGQLVNILAGSNGAVLKMTGHEKVYQRIILVAAILNIILNVVLVPIYGMNGAALAVMITTILWNIFGAGYARAVLKIRTYFFLPW